MASIGFIFIKELFMPLGIPKVTSPLPERIAACAVKIAAPEKLGEPAIIKTWPKSPL
jgi:hypothetical protein